MKRLTTLFACLTLILGVILYVAAPVLAAANSQALCEGSGGTWKADKDLPNGGSCTSADGRTVAGTIQQLTDVLIFIIGAIAVLMIIIGAIRYVLSAGDQAALTSAKNTILYAIIGLVLAFSSYAIIHFVYAAFNIK
ncbi:MAG TPA: hypothetical protein VM581_00845 [Magnetospirillaceae bacterium]|nr:hypothetical protein [Magnetospirillaceae bacterium]